MVYFDSVTFVALSTCILEVFFETYDLGCSGVVSSFILVTFLVV